MAHSPSRRMPGGTAPVRRAKRPILCPARLTHGCTGSLRPAGPRLHACDVCHALFEPKDLEWATRHDSAGSQDSDK